MQKIKLFSLALLLLACCTLPACDGSGIRKNESDEISDYKKKEKLFDDMNDYLKKSAKIYVCDFSKSLDSITHSIESEVYNKYKDDTLKYNTYVREQQKIRFKVYCDKIGVKDSIIAMAVQMGKSECVTLEAMEKARYDMTDAIHKMSVAFEGSPSEDKVKLLIEGVMEKWNLEKTNDQALGIGNALVAMRKSSKVGVTEMEVLKYTYQLGDTKLKLPEAIGLAASMLELSK